MINIISRSEAFKELKKIGIGIEDLRDLGHEKEGDDCDYYVFHNYTNGDNPFLMEKYYVNPLTGRFMSDDNRNRGFLPHYVFQSARVLVNGITQKEVVVFPKKFIEAPNVIVSGYSTVPGTEFLEVTSASITSTEFTIVKKRTNTTNTNVHWLATGRVAGSSSIG